jgi:hypothetical protein
VFSSRVQITSFGVFAAANDRRKLISSASKALSVNGVSVRRQGTASVPAISTQPGIIMKKLAVLAFVAISASAFATQPTSEITISGNSTQAAVLVSTATSNAVSGHDNKAQQNLASNAGNIKIGGNSLQAVLAGNSAITNGANGHDNVATQSLSSNVGKVTVGGSSTQITALLGANVSNFAQGHDNLAVQNIASNNACFTCQ